MKILIIDIETTGFVPEGQAIVEIGLVLCDSDTRETVSLFDKVVKDNEFNYDKHKNSWIFQNTKLTPEEVRDAVSLEVYREELQSYFDQYLLTAYNKKFDLNFLRARDFKIKDTKCLMENGKSIAFHLTGKSFNPSVEKLYNWLFPEENYIELHRGLDDALHEAKMFYKFCDIKAGKKVIMEYK